MKQTSYRNQQGNRKAAPLRAIQPHGFISRIATVTAFSCLTLLSPIAAHAQSAANFNPKVPTPNERSAKPNKAASPAAKDAGPINATPSRYVAEADVAAYVESMTAVFSMKGRATDPFGQIQDPNAKPVIKNTVAKKPGRIAPAQAIPLSDILQRVKVTTIMPREKRFLVGTQVFKLGGRMGLVFRNKNIVLEITSISSRQIDFRNLDSGETASLKIDLLPIGMTPGTRGITAPGMAPSRADSPINLDDGNPL